MLLELKACSDGAEPLLRGLEVFKTPVRAARLAEAVPRVYTGVASRAQDVPLVAFASTLAAADHSLVRILAPAPSIVREHVGDCAEVNDAGALSDALARARWSELGGGDLEKGERREAKRLGDRACLKGRKRPDRKSSRRRSKRRSRRRSRSSDSSRSRVTPSSSSESEEKRPNRRYLHWEGPWKDGSRKVSSTVLSRMQGMRLKRRSDRYTIAQDYPGGLGARFLMHLRQKLLGGPPKKVRDLNRTDTGRWAVAMTGPKGIRHMREAHCLSRSISELSSNKFPAAVDAAHRIKEALLAKRSDQGTWEKASLASLLPSGQASMPAPLPDGALDL